MATTSKMRMNVFEQSGEGRKRPGVPRPLPGLVPSEGYIFNVIAGEHKDNLSKAQAVKFGRPEVRRELLSKRK